MRQQGRFVSAQRKIWERDRRFVSVLVMQIRFLTPKALAKFQPGVGAQATTRGKHKIKKRETLKGFAARGTLSGFERLVFLFGFPWLSLALQPWAEISQRLRR